MFIHIIYIIINIGQLTANAFTGWLTLSCTSTKIYYYVIPCMCGSCVLKINYYYMYLLCVILYIELTVAGEAASRSIGSNMRLVVGASWMISPLIKHSFLLSSSTVFMFSIQIASTGPSNISHFLSGVWWQEHGMERLGTCHSIVLFNQSYWQITRVQPLKTSFGQQKVPHFTIFVFTWFAWPVYVYKVIEDIYIYMSWGCVSNCLRFWHNKRFLSFINHIQST